MASFSQLPAVIKRHCFWCSSNKIALLILLELYHLKIDHDKLIGNLNGFILVQFLMAAAATACQARLSS